MFIEFNIFKIKKENVSNVVNKDYNYVHSGGIPYKINIQETDDLFHHKGSIHFDESYQPSECILKEKAEMTLSSIFFNETISNKKFKIVI